MDSRLRAEIDRVDTRPPADACPPVLSAFTVDIIDAGAGSLERYASRVRGAMAAGLVTAAGALFTEDDLDDSQVQPWFAAVSSDDFDPTTVPAEVSEGRDRYIGIQRQEIWPIQDWLWAFEPGMRQWEWWDITAAGGGSVQIWLDSKGELAFQCEDVRWLAYVAGARSLAGPIVLPRIVWEGQASLAVRS